MDSEGEDSDDASRYAGMTAEELNSIWEERNVAYFDRRQRKQHDSVAHNSCSCSSISSVYTLDELGAGAGFAASALSSSQPQRGQQRQQLTRPAGYVCAADDPQWRAFTSRNIMGDYDPERARREPAYHDAWVSCERLVNMRRSGATAAGVFIPTNPRLAALLEQRKLEVARERFGDEGITVGKRSNLKAPSSSRGYSAGENSVHLPVPVKKSYFMALPYPTQLLPKSVYCDRCNCELFTSPLAKRFFCQTCGSVTCVPMLNAEASFDEKMQDAVDQDHQKMSDY